MFTSSPNTFSTLSVFGSIAISALLFSSCSEIEDLDNFEVPVEENITIQGQSALEVLIDDFPALDQFNEFDLAQSSTFRNKDYGPDDVDSVYLESLVFTTADPTDQDLSFFGTIIFYVQTPDLPKKEIARQENFPEGQTSVSFTTTSDDLKNYLLAPELDFSVETTGSRRPPQETVVNVKAIFDVDVNVL